MNTSSQKHSHFFPQLIVALLGGCAVLTFSSCSKKASVAIIGKWQVQGDKETIEFRKDGTFTGSEDGNGTYIFTDNSHMECEFSNTNAPANLNCTVHIHGDAMDVAMTIPGQHKSNTSHLKRIK